MSNETNSLPKVYTSNIVNSNVNQHFFRTNPISQFIENQNRVNDQLHHSINTFTQSLLNTKQEQHHYYQQVVSHLERQESKANGVNEKIENHEKKSASILDKVILLERQNEELRKKIENDSIINKAIMDHLASQESYSQKLVKRLEEHNQVMCDMKEELINQQEIYEKLNEKLDMQEVFHQTLLERLEQQEAITQKIVRQVDHLKSVIYERFSHFADKIEDSMKLTSGYLFSYLTKPTLLKSTKEDKKTNSEKV
ncbi:hypothetical protein ACFSCX_11930 [Bacillus salitolerans]|uniref:Uncharacterized protein n=1 Tax=Bacillus salitolerans TaxID=1437434 RepID=A0ABW4LRV8_9BACI